MDEDINRRRDCEQGLSSLEQYVVRFLRMRSAGQEQGGSRIFSRLSLRRVSVWRHLHEVGLAVRHCSRRNALMMFFSLVKSLYVVIFAFVCVPPAAVMAVMAIHHSGRRKKQVNSARIDQRIIRARPVRLAGTSRRSLSQQRWHPGVARDGRGRRIIRESSDARRSYPAFTSSVIFGRANRSTVCDQIAEA
jgi:hypothetical protein